MSEFKIGQRVTCADMPGKFFQIAEVIGEGSVAMYMLRDENMTHYGYVRGDELKQEAA